MVSGGAGLRGLPLGHSSCIDPPNSAHFGARARHTERTMKQDVHPDYHTIKIVMTDGSALRNALRITRLRGMPDNTS